MTSTDIIKQLEHYPGATVHDIKDDQLRKELQNIPKTTLNIRDKKINGFLDVYRTAVDYAYKIKDPILIRYFLWETVEESNNDLIKNNKQYRVNFGDEMFNNFADQNEAYLKEKDLYNHDGTINGFKLEEHLEYLEKLVRSWRFSKKRFLIPKEIESDLTTLYL